MIQTEGLRKNFGSFQALKGIDLRVEKGEIYGFLGQNGAGKSTAMNILAGLSKANAGTCEVNGWDLAKIAHPGDLHIGYLPEEPSFYPWMTGRETLQYLGSRWQGNVEKRVQEMLGWVGLMEAANRRVGGYSRGMKQRLGMAAALFYDSDLILLDEPSSALDPEGRSDVLSLILDLKARGKTVFLSTHILSDAERVCDRVGILAHGQMVVEKTLEALYAENVQSIYDVTIPKTMQDTGLINRLSRLPGIHSVEAAGDKISISVDSPENSGKTLLNFFASTDLMVESFTLRRASLEDIFLEEVAKNGH
ncbi:ABC transporter ATP-binding protein [Candidatus Contubernalis alkaliaceticus]|uniref:ABC transporter ATP-binding protein n=1 Tax=Candidatus Contubernalis alkaliaceticus TaxID=338645 RepID=UPI001F4C240E|nr:ABC transporter ATP-binding protein [Candidatus Contubernalis alkalaceticus]UNC92195.1 ABC transporter ATP-binding protein [Candidatus Contubernalis alkalaceticus]